jgi:hypothetical protein
MTKRDVLLLKSVPPAEQSLVTTMPANRTQSYGGSGWPLAHRGAVGTTAPPLDWSAVEQLRKSGLGK